MADFYTGMAALVTRLLLDKGQAGSVRTRAVSSSDDAAGTVTLGTAVDTPANIVKTTWKEQYFEGTLVESGDSFYLLDKRVNPEDSIVVSSVERAVLAVQVIQPADVFVACKVLTRGSVESVDSDTALYDVDGDALTFVDGETIQTVD